MWSWCHFIFRNTPQTFCCCNHIRNSIEETIQANINYCKKFDLNIKETDKSLLIMYWLLKMHEKPTGWWQFVVASKSYSTKPLSNRISKIFKMIFNAVKSFHNKSFFYWDCKKLWVVQSPFLVVTKLIKISVKRKTISISTFDYSNLDTTTPNKHLLKVLSKTINFVFKSKVFPRGKESY